MKRRDFLVQGGAIGLPLQAQALSQSSPRYTGKPELKITDLGLVDVSRFQLVPLEAG